MNVSHCTQGSEEWFNLRRGRPTASRFKDIITPKTGVLSKSSVGYMRELVTECFVPDYAKFIGNKWTDRGTELEPEALEALAQRLDCEIEPVGFVTRDDEVVGCSPDGLIKGGGEFIAGAEVKCPAGHTHISYVEAGKLPDTYKPQVHGSMAVTGLDRWHFFSYFPGMQPLHVVVERDAYTDKVSKALDQFLIDYRDYREKMIPKLQLEAGE